MTEFKDTLKLGSQKEYSFQIKNRKFTSAEAIDIDAIEDNQYS